MVSSHVWLSPYSRKSSGQTGGELVRYFMRQGEFNPEDYFRRTGEWADKYTDLVDHGTQNLPVWANDDPGKFFAAAREHESADRWYWGFQVEFSLPRELTHEQQMALREDFMRATMPNLPALWVKHDKRLPSGEMHPHVHILLSARQPDGIDRDEVQTFKLWQRAHPEQGGAPRDIFWSKKQAPEQLRQAFSDISNYHLERAGVLERLDVRSLRRQGNSRLAIRREEPERERPDPATRAREQAKAREAWEQRKVHRGLENVWAISREGMVGHVRDWTRNVVPGKALERSSPEVVLAWLEKDAQRLTREKQGYERELYQVGRQRMVLEYREGYGEVETRQHVMPSHPRVRHAERETAPGRERAGRTTRELDDITVPTMDPEKPHGRAVRTRVFDRERESR